MSDQVILDHTHQGYIVGGAGLPRNACWGIHDNYTQAYAEAYEIAEDFGLTVVVTLAVDNARIMSRNGRQS